LSAGGHRAQRTCLGCRQVQEQESLVRYVLAPDGGLLVDYRHRLPGRGAYTCISSACVREALRRRQFARALRRELPAVDAGDLLLELHRQILQRVLNLLGMARKASQTISGSNQVLDALAVPGRVSVVIMAEDLSAGIAEKVIGRAAAAGVRSVRLFDKGTLGDLLGKGERSVVALVPGNLAAAIMTELSRYENIVGER
jgi:hypothetical protein